LARLILTNIKVEEMLQSVGIIARKTASKNKVLKGVSIYRRKIKKLSYIYSRVSNLKTFRLNRRTPLKKDSRKNRLEKFP
jgi:hypothetical protein